jgi:hypothetical protein
VSALAATDVPSTRAPARRRTLRLLPPPPHPTSPRATQVPGQQALQLEFQLSNGLPAVPRVARSVHQHAPASSVVPWAGRLAQAVLEVVAAERPAAQLSTWVVPQVFHRLERRHRVKARELDPTRPRGRCAEQVQSIHVCHPTPDIAEVSVVSNGVGRNGDRCRGLAFRLERRNERWICTELDWP